MTSAMVNPPPRMLPEARALCGAFSRCWAFSRSTANLNARACRAGSELLADNVSTSPHPATREPGNDALAAVLAPFLFEVRPTYRPTAHGALLRPPDRRALRAALSSWPIEQRADLLQEVFRQARLQDEGVTPCRDGVHSAVALNAPGAGDDGDVSRAAVLLQPPDRLPPVDLRQRQVHDDHVWLSAKGRTDRRRAIAGQDVAEAVVGKIHRVHLARVRVIVHDEDERRRTVHFPHQRTFTLRRLVDNP